uniref:pilus assembly protein TadG-related protein n=1 Tax=Stappia sp. TaxID=1870903 RepID=UPI003BA898FA
MKSDHRPLPGGRLRAIRIPSLLRMLARDRRGNIVIPLAICVALMVLIVGAGIDFARGYNAKVSLQAAVDATALAANYDSNGLSDGKIRQNAVDYFNSIYTPPPGATPKLDVSVEKGTVTVNGTLDLPANFGGILGMSSMEIGVQSQTVVGKATFDVAMVLDNSGSMRGSKLTTLKNAAKDLAETLLEVNQVSDKKDRVKIGLVPFTSFVNVGSDKSGAAWMDQEGRSPIHWKNFEVRADGTPDPKEFDSRYLTNGRPSRFTLFKQLRGTDWRGCVEARPSPHDVTNTPPGTGDPATLFVPQFSPDEPDSQNKKWGDYVYNSYLNDDMGACTRDAKYVYSSKGMDRWEYAQKRLCKYKNQPQNFGTTWQKGPNYNCRTEPLTELTENKSTVLQAIRNLRADGNTNIHMGAVWGWRLLSKGAPFNSARTEEDNEDGEHVRILIVMTDGQNTYGSRGRWFMNTEPEAYGYGAEERLGYGINSSWSIANTMDSRLATTCSNAKADGVQVYTIAFQISDQNTVNMMRNCASKAAMAFDARSNSDLVDAFKRIADEITRLRLNR